MKRLPNLTIGRLVVATPSLMASHDTAALLACTFSPCGDYLVCGSASGRLHVFAIPTPAAADMPLQPPVHCTSFRGAPAETSTPSPGEMPSPSPGETPILSLPSWNRTVEAPDATTEGWAATPLGTAHGQALSSLVFAPSAAGALLLSGADEEIRGWRWAELTMPGAQPKPVLTLQNPRQPQRRGALGELTDTEVRVRVRVRVRIRFRVRARRAHRHRG